MNDYIHQYFHIYCNNNYGNVSACPQVRNESKIIRYTNYQVAANCKIITTYTHYKGALHKHPQLLMHFRMKCTKCKLSSCNGQKYLCPFCKHTTVCQDESRMHLLLKHNQMGSHIPTPERIADEV